MIISTQINVSKLDRNKDIYTSPKTGHKYLNIVLFENKGGPDQYNNDGVVKLSIPKEERDKGETNSKILGNWKYLRRPDEKAPQSSQAARQRPSGAEDDSQDEIPF